jgi:hypothetical protein
LVRFPSPAALPGLRGRPTAADFRRRFPLHARLKTRVQYVLTRHPAFFLFGDGPRESLCGFRRWNRFTIDITCGRSVDALTGSSRGQLGLGDDVMRAGLVRLLIAIFEWAGGPIHVDDLVLAAGRVLGIVEFTMPPSISHEHVADPARLTASEPEHPGGLELAAYVDRQDGPSSMA